MITFNNFPRIWAIIWFLIIKPQAVWIDRSNGTLRLLNINWCKMEFSLQISDIGSAKQVLRENVFDGMTDIASKLTAKLPSICLHICVDLSNFQESQAGIVEMKRPWQWTLMDYSWELLGWAGLIIIQFTLIEISKELNIS